MLTARKHRPLSEPDRTVSCRACRPPHPVMLPQSGCSRLRYPRGSGLGQRRSISFSAGRASRCRREIRRTKVSYQCVCVCVCVFSSHSLWTSSSLDVPAAVTQEEGHTEFSIHPPSAVRAFIFLARRIQPFLSLVDREVEFCVLTI